jgi:NTP pyrophosphatase (non-canonical NTP hydrolase)
MSALTVLPWTVCGKGHMDPALAAVKHGVRHGRMARRRTGMIDDEDDPPPRPKRLQPLTLDRLGVEELRDYIAELRAEIAAGARAKLAEEMGDVLFVVANLARKLDLDPEACLRAGCDKFERRFGAVEALLAAQGLAPTDAGLAAMEEAWQAVKKAEKPD